MSVSRINQDLTPSNVPPGFFVLYDQGLLNHAGRRRTMSDIRILDS